MTATHLRDTWQSIARRLTVTDGWQRACVLVTTPHHPLARIRALGSIGTIAVAAGGSLTGSLPVGTAQIDLLGLRRIGGHVDLGVVGVYAGLTLLMVAWWLLGRLVLAGRFVPGGRDTETADAVTADITPASLLVTLVCWAAPLLICPPLFSRDVYSYLAQGAMVRDGIDVYHNGPAALGGPLAAEVPALWQHAPAPYGPVFLLYAAAIIKAVGTDPVLGVLGMRAVALLGVGALALCLPWLARRCRGSATVALWLGVLNPLVLAHLVAGAHNDALMLGLLVAGLAATVAGRPIVGVVVVTLAALVKVPAALGLVFLVPLWAAQLRGRWREFRAIVGTTLVAACCSLLVTAAVGTGFGWVLALETPASAHNWSLTSALGRLTGSMLELAGVGVAADAMAPWRWIGLGLAVLAGFAAWLHRERLGAVHALGLAMGAIVLLGPALRPWYALWAIVPLAATALSRRSLTWAAAACSVLVLVVRPNGFAPDAGDIAQAVLGVGLALAGLLVVGRWAAAPFADVGRSSDPATAGAAHAR